LGTAFKPSRGRGIPCRTEVAGVASIPEGHPRYDESGFRALIGRSAGGNGTASNPVQRRLSEHDLDDPTLAYVEGSSIDALARRFSIHRTTVIGHLDRLGVSRRRTVRTMTDRTVRQAATRYRRGESLKVVAANFGVVARILAREFSRAGVQIRSRRGWRTQHDEPKPRQQNRQQTRYTVRR
jgi:hypothetical protein